MAKIMVMIDVPEMSYSELKDKLIDNPDPDWFEKMNPKTGKIAVDSSRLEIDSEDDYCYLFELIGVRP